MHVAVQDWLHTLRMEEPNDSIPTLENIFLIILSEFTPSVKKHRVIEALGDMFNYQNRAVNSLFIKSDIVTLGEMVNCQNVNPHKVRSPKSVFPLSL